MLQTAGEANGMGSQHIGGGAAGSSPRGQDAPRDEPTRHEGGYREWHGTAAGNHNTRRNAFKTSHSRQQRRSASGASHR